MNNIENDVLINTEQSYEYDKRFDNMMNISGYTDVEFIATDQAGKTNGFRLHHMSLFFTKDFGNKWTFFSEIEYEDAPKFEAEEGEDVDGAAVFKAHRGKIFLEAVNMTYLHKPEMSVRVGRFFTPAGIWSVDHYPPFVGTQERPQHIRKIFPQLVDGGGMFGSIAMEGNKYLNYDLYLGNGESTYGKKDNNNHKAVGGKASFLFPIWNHFELGASYYVDKDGSGKEKTATGLHAKFRFNNITVQSEYASDEILNADGSLNKENEGFYIQMSMDIKDYTFGTRYDMLDTSAHTPTGTANVMTSVFANYHASADTVIKVELHNIDKEDVSTTSSDYAKLIFSLVTYLGN